VRSHRHRLFHTGSPTANGTGLSVVTPCWQLKTPYSYRLAGARLSQPQIGGILLRLFDDGIGLLTKTFDSPRPDEEII